MKSAIIIFFAAGILLRCNGEPDFPFSYQIMANCPDEQVWDSTAISNRLIGQWKWVYGWYEFQHPYGNDTIFKGLEYVFYNNSTLEIISKDGSKTEYEWSVKERTGGGYVSYIVATVPLSTIMGSILFCEDYVLFHANESDGMDMYFVKIDTGSE